MKLHELKEKRAKTVARMRAMVDAAERESRDLSEAERAEFETAKAEERALQERIDRAALVAEAERRMDVDPNDPGRVDDFTGMCRRFSLTKAIVSHLPDAPKGLDAGLELEVSQELGRRSLKPPAGFMIPLQVFQVARSERAGTVGGSAGNLVSTDLRADLFIDLLRAKLKVGGMGATVLDGLVGNVAIPRLTGSATAQWVAEHSAVTGSDNTFDQVTMTPKTVGALVEWSRRTLLQTTPAVEQLCRNDLAFVLAKALDAAAIKGGGSNQPTGVLGTAGITHVDVDAAPAWGDVLDLIAALEIDETMGSGWLTTPQAVKKMRKTVRVASTDSVFIMNDAGTLANYPLASTTQVPSNLVGDGSPGPTGLSALIFGNWSDLLIGYWSGVDIVVNPYADSVFAKGGVLINAFLDCGLALRHPESFAYSRLVTT